jgi:thioredoxin reductase (NADPH)
MRDIIIIGKGPAGISAALYLKRAGIDPLVIGKDLGALEAYRTPIENYYGLKGNVTGQELIKDGIHQAEALGITVKDDAVIALTEIENGFEIETLTEIHHARVVLLATGKTRQTLSIPGFKTYRGKGISMCAMCDGYFYRNKSLAIIGCGPYMAKEADILMRLSKNVTVFTNGNPLETEVPFQVVTEPIKAFKGDHRVRTIETDGKSYETEGIFVAIGVPSSLEFASQLGVIMDKETLMVDHRYMTNVNGLFAAGDVIGGRLQIAKAAFDGMTAADHIYQYLKPTKK